MTDITATIEPSSLEKAIAGELQPGPVQPSHHMMQIGVAGALQDLGIQPEIVRAVLDGSHKVSASEYARTQNWKADKMADQEWVARYMNGGREEKRLMTLADIIISGGIHDDKVA